jgi:hypothetical protein
MAARIAYSVWGIVMGWTVRGPNTGGDQIFCASRPAPRPTHQVSTGVNRPERDADHPPSSSAGLRMVRIYTSTPSLHWHVIW